MSARPEHGTGERPTGEPSAALFPPWPERERIDDELTRKLAEAQARVAAGSATPTLDLEAFRRELAAFDFAAPRAVAGAARLVRRRARARDRASDPSALFRALQSGTEFSGAVRRPAGRLVQPAGGELVDLAGGRGARGARHPHGGAACRISRAVRRPLHLGRIRGELHGHALRPDARASAVRGRRRARLSGSAGVLHLAGVPPQLGQDRAPSRHRAQRRAAGGDRRDGPHVRRGARGRPSPPIGRPAAYRC